MASTALDSRYTAGYQEQHEKKSLNDQARREKLSSIPGNDSEAVVQYATEDLDQFTPHHDNTHRRLKPRHIQLIGIGGCVHMSHHQFRDFDTSILRSLITLGRLGQPFLCRLVCSYPFRWVSSNAHYRIGRSLTEVICIVKQTGSPR